MLFFEFGDYWVVAFFLVDWCFKLPCVYFCYFGEVFISSERVLMIFWVLRSVVRDVISWAMCVGVVGFWVCLFCGG